MASDSIQKNKLSIEQKIAQAQKHLRDLTLQINLNSPRTSQAIHKLRLLPDAFKIKTEQEIEKVFRFQMQRGNSLANFERSQYDFNDFEDSNGGCGGDSDPETEKLPNNSKKRYYKHLKEIISKIKFEKERKYEFIQNDSYLLMRKIPVLKDKYEKAVQERQLLMKEDTDLIRSTLYGNEVPMTRKFKIRDPFEIVDFDSKIEQMNNKKQKCIDVIGKQAMEIFKNEFEFRQWQKADQLKYKSTSKAYHSFVQKRIDEAKKDRLKRKQRFENIHQRNQERFQKKHEKQVREMEKREEKFSSFFSSRYDTTNRDQRKEKEKEKVDAIHKNLEQAAQKEDFKIHALKMRQEEKDLQSQQLVQDSLNERIEELKRKNEEKYQKQIKAQEILEEKQEEVLGSFVKKMEGANVRLSMKEKELKKLLMIQRKKELENLKKHDGRLDKLDQNLEKQKEILNRRDEKRVEQIKRQAETRDIEATRKGESLQEKLDANAVTQNQNWLTKQKKNEQIIERHKHVKEMAQRISQERQSLQEAAMMNTLKVNMVKESLDYSLQLMKNDSVDKLYNKYQKLHLSDSAIARFFNTKKQEEVEDNSGNETSKEKERSLKNMNPPKWGDTKLVLSPKVQHVKHSGTASLFRSLL